MKARRVTQWLERVLVSLLLVAAAMAPSMAAPAPVTAPVAPAVSAPAAEAKAAAPKLQVTARYGQSVRGLIDDLPFVVLRGTLQERGEAYGALCGKDCVEMMNTVILPIVQKMSPDAWQMMVALSKAMMLFPKDDAVQAAAFIEGFRKAVPEADRKMPALGRELGVDDLRLAQGFVDLDGAGRIMLGGCSSFSVWGDLAAGGGTITGRNSDYQTFPGRFPMMVVAQQPSEKDRLATIEVSGPGVLGASTAMNEEGVFLALNNETGLPPRAAGGFWPRISALRPAIETARAASAVKDVAAALRGKAPMMGCIVHVSVPTAKGKGALPSVIEWDGNPLTEGVTVREPEGGAGAGFILSTNNYLKRREGPPETTGDSARRLKILDGALAAVREAKGKVDLEKAEAMLDSVAPQGGFMTYLSVIAFPDTRRLVIAVTPKTGVPATKGHWVEVDWQQVFAAK
jgi:hypothetical protein